MQALVGQDTLQASFSSSLFFTIVQSAAGVVVISGQRRSSSVHVKTSQEQSSPRSAIAPPVQYGVAVSSHLPGHSGGGVGQVAVQSLFKVQPSSKFKGFEVHVVNSPLSQTSQVHAVRSPADVVVNSPLEQYMVGAGQEQTGATWAAAKEREQRNTKHKDNGNISTDWEIKN